MWQKMKTIWCGIRPRTLTIAFVPTAFGILAAYKEGGFEQTDIITIIANIFLLMSASGFLLCGVNIMNNFFDDEVGEELERERKIKIFNLVRSERKIFYFKTGIFFYVIAGIIGIFFVFASNWMLAVLLAIGFLGAYSYDGEPIRYKRLGLGVPAAFIFTGLLMTLGGYLAVAHRMSALPVIYSLPYSAFASAILLANEIRDYDDDVQKKAGTITSRFGLRFGTALYCFFITFAYVDAVILVLLKIVPIFSLAVLASLIAILPCLKGIKNHGKGLVTATAKLHLVFSSILFLSILFF